MWFTWSLSAWSSSARLDGFAGGLVVVAGGAGGLQVRVVVGAAEGCGLDVVDVGCGDGAVGKSELAFVVVAFEDARSGASPVAWEWESGAAPGGHGGDAAMSRWISWRTSAISLTRGARVTISR